MKLDHLTDLRLTIDPDAFVKAPQTRAGLWHLLERLFSGEEIAEAELETWGLRVALVDEFVAIPRAE